MQESDYHKEWHGLRAGKTRFEYLRFLYYDVLVPVLTRNGYYYRCKKGKSNSGICSLLEEFDSYIDGKVDPGERKIKLFGETAYGLWLLGVKLESEFDSVLQKRINESFKGCTYYETGVPGFRQFEFETQVICRLVEENIAFRDIDNQGEPDLLVLPDTDASFYMEVKMPTANLALCLDKALRQIRPDERKGAVVVNLDHLLANTTPEKRQDHIQKWIGEAKSKVLGKDTVIAVEYLPYEDSESANDCFRCDRSCVAKTVLDTVCLALTGESQLPEDYQFD
jgi:hypothetical protein